MHCKALNKNGDICGVQLDPGSVNWCTYHCKKMIKYYKTYKQLEKSINFDQLVSCQNFDHYTTDNLININLKLLKVYHYRTTLRQQGYPDYHDEGHDHRIKIILKLIEKLWTTICDKSMTQDEQELDDDINTPSKLPRATSTRKLKKKIEKFSSSFQIRTDDMAITDKIVENVFIKYKSVLFNHVKEYFFNKFGEEKGLKLFMTSLTFALGIAVITSHKYDRQSHTLKEPGDFIVMSETHETVVSDS